MENACKVRHALREDIKLVSENGRQKVTHLEVGQIASAVNNPTKPPQVQYFHDAREIRYTVGSLETQTPFTTYISQLIHTFKVQSIVLLDSP